MDPDKLRELCVTENLFTQIIHYFPYPLAVFSSDGTLKAINSTLISKLELSSETDMTGKFNIFRHTFRVHNGISKAVKQAFKGKTTNLYDLKSLLRIFGLDGSHPGENKINCLDVYDAVVFPVTVDEGKVSYAVMALISHPKRIKAENIN